MGFNKKMKKEKKEKKTTTTTNNKQQQTCCLAGQAAEKTSDRCLFMSHLTYSMFPIFSTLDSAARMWSRTSARVKSRTSCGVGSGEVGSGGVGSGEVGSGEVGSDEVGWGGVGDGRGWGLREVKEEEEEEEGEEEEEDEKDRSLARSLHDHTPQTQRTHLIPPLAPFPPRLLQHPVGVCCEEPRADVDHLGLYPNPELLR